MDIKKSFILNYGFSLFSQISNFVMRFFVRKMFIMYFGVALLGYNSTFGNILSLLNMAELGIGFAISYKLYKPVYENDYSTINSLLIIYKKLFDKIRKFIFVTGILLIPLLPIILNASYSNILHFAGLFIVQLCVTTSSYILSYRKILINVYEKNYVISKIEIVGNIFLFILQISAILYFNNYYLFVLSEAVYMLFINLLSHRKCKQMFQFIDDKNIDDTKQYKDILLDVKKDIKNVVIVKLGGYVLNSTDFIVVSSILGSLYSGLLSNYTMIFITVQNFILIAMNSVQSIIGNLSHSTEDKEIVEKLIIKFTKIMAIIVIVFCPVAYKLANNFIQIWVGNDYMLSNSIALFYSLNMAIMLLSNPISLLFSSIGYFKYDRNIILISATLNILISVTLVLSVGAVGVLVGTFIAILIYWGSRIIILKNNYFKSVTLYLKNIVFIIISIIGAYLLIYAIPINSQITGYLDFILIGIKLELVVTIYGFTVIVIYKLLKKRRYI